MRRAYKFRVYPTTGQTSRAAQCLRDHRRLYNAALEERREAWRMRKVSIRYGQQSAQLKDIRAADPDQSRWSFSSQQATLRRLDKAMAAFYRRCRAGQKPGYPRFRALDRWDSVEWPSDGDGCRWKPDMGRVYLRGIGHVKVHAHRPVQGKVKTVTLKREGRRWYVVLSCDDVPAVPLPATGRKVGEVHRRIRDRRRDFHHKTARAMVNSCDAIGLENLNTAGMTRRPEPKPDPDKPGEYLPNGAASKSGLNKSILDAGWAQFASILTGKAEEAGRRIILVNPAGTSINCHKCGRRCTRPRQDTVVCPVHGPMDADLNGAINIAIRAGLGSGQARAA